MRPVGKQITGAFTLVEIVAVMLVMMLIVGIVAAGIMKPRASLMLQNVAHSLQLFLAQSAAYAQITGNEEVVIFNSGDKTFTRIASAGSHQETAASPASAFELPDSVTAEFRDVSETEIKFRFFPDGSAACPAAYLVCNGHSMEIMVSPLTGNVSVRHVEE